MNNNKRQRQRRRRVIPMKNRFTKEQPKTQKGGKIEKLKNQLKTLEFKGSFEFEPDFKNVLVYADFGCSTGFGNVAKHIIDKWQKRRDIKMVIYSINDYQHQEPYDYADNIVVFPAYLNDDVDAMGRNDLFGRKNFLKLLYQNDFDAVFLLNDIEIYSHIAEHIEAVKKVKKKEGRKSFKQIMYFPVDSVPLQEEIEQLKHLDVAITYTKYGKDVVESACADVKDVKIINHAVDCKTFKPLKKSVKNMRKKYMKGFEDKFVFGSVNRNQVRKDLGNLLLGYKSMLDHYNWSLKGNGEYKEPVLYLHCNPTDSMGINVERACKRLELEIGKHVIFPPEFSENKGFSLEELNEIYNCFDCFVTTTTAEGWGLTIHEAMSCGVPVIAPLHTSINEVTDNGEFIYPLIMLNERIFFGDHDKLRYQTDVSELYQKMEWVYDKIHHNPKVLKQKVDKAREFANRLSWDDVADEFNDILTETLIQK